MKKLILPIVVSLVIGLLVFVYVLYSETGQVYWKNDFFPYLLPSMLLLVAISMALQGLNNKLNDALPWKKSVSTRLVVGFMLDFLLALLLSVLGAYVVLGFHYGNWSVTVLFMEHVDLLLKLLILGTVILLVYNIVYFALYSYNQYAVAHIEALQNRREQLELQFDALKGQLSPHYLFNCLNTISSLSFKNPNNAEDFIRRLAQTYHYILSSSERNYVSIEEELEFVKSYYYLLQVRFQNNLNMVVNIPKNILASPIPPLTLQMLVENAVKHNVIGKENPLYIYISAVDNTKLVVANTKTQKPAHVDSFNMGLKNIEARYQYLTPRKIRVDNGKKFTVQLPVVQPGLTKSA